MTRPRRSAPSGYPRWVPPLVALPPVFFGIVTISVAGRGRGAVAVAIGLAILPWLVNAMRPGWLPGTVFALWVIVPLAVLNIAGGAFGVDLTADAHNKLSFMILVWLTGEMAARGRLVPWLLTPLATVGVIVGRTVVEPGVAHDWIFWVGGTGVAFVTGFLLRRQQLTLSALREAQVALAGEAAQRERQRIAREVHDVVAHTLTVTLMHVSAARRALEHDPSSAREALAEAETLGRRSLADVRRTVGLLRAEDEAPDTHALPDASDIPTLLASYRAAGTRLDVDVSGDLAALAPATGLTLYRVVQEALANAANHAAGAPVDVQLRVRRHNVEAVVSNPVTGEAATRAGGGLGLVGMRERVSLLGGRLDAGERDGVWTVRAALPLETISPATGART